MGDAGPKMAAAGSGGAGGPGPGPRGRWGGCLWVRGVLLVLGGLPAGAGAAPVSLGTSPPCRHHVLSDTEVINKVHLKTNHVTKRDADGHLRIKTIYDQSIEELLPEKRYLVKNKLFPQAISYLEKTFQVRRPAGRILLSRQCATNQYLRKENDPHRYCTGEVPSPYCDTLRSNPLQLTCRQDQRAVAVCNLQRFPNPLPPEYQCPPETDPPAANLTRALPLDLCSCSSSLVVTLWLLLGNLFPLLAGFLLCVWH